MEFEEITLNPTLPEVENDTMTEMEGKNRSRRCWSPREEEHLFEIWGRENWRLTRHGKNTIFFAQWSDEMKERFNIDVKPEDIQHKVNQTRCKFRQVKKLLDADPNANKWKKFDIIDKIVRNQYRPQNAEPIPLEALEKNRDISNEEIVKCVNQSAPISNVEIDGITEDQLLNLDDHNLTAVSLDDPNLGSSFFTASDCQSHNGFGSELFTGGIEDLKTEFDEDNYTNNFIRNYPYQDTTLEQSERQQQQQQQQQQQSNNNYIQQPPSQLNENGETQKPGYSQQEPSIVLVHPQHLQQIYEIQQQQQQQEQQQQRQIIQNIKQESINVYEQQSTAQPATTQNKNNNTKPVMVLTKQMVVVNSNSTTTPKPSTPPALCVTNIKAMRNQIITKIRNGPCPTLPTVMNNSGQSTTQPEGSKAITTMPAPPQRASGNVQPMRKRRASAMSNPVAINSTGLPSPSSTSTALTSSSESFESLYLLEIKKKNLILEEQKEISQKRFDLEKRKVQLMERFFPKCVDLQEKILSKLCVNGTASVAGFVNSNGNEN